MVKRSITPLRHLRTSANARAVIGYGVWGATWTLVGLGLLMAMLSAGQDRALGFEIHAEFFVLDAIIAGVYGPASSVVLRRSRHPVGWIFAAIALGFATSAFGSQYAVLGAWQADLPAYALIVQLTTAGWLVGACSVVLVLPWVLDRKAVGGWAHAARAGIALTAFAFCSRMLIQLPDGPANPVAPSREVSQLALDVDGWIIPFYFLYGLVGVFALAFRYRRATVEDRRGLAWVIASLGLVTVSYITFETGLSLGGPLPTDRGRGTVRGPDHAAHCDLRPRGATAAVGPGPRQSRAARSDESRGSGSAQRSAVATAWSAVSVS